MPLSFTCPSGRITHSTPRQHMHAHLTDGGRRERLTNYSRSTVYGPLHLTLGISLQYAPRREERQG